MVNWLLSLPVLVKVLTSLLLILILHAITHRLHLAILAGILALAFSSGHGMAEAGSIAFERLTDTSNLMLLAVVYMVVMLSSQMSRTGMMRRLVVAVRRRVSREHAMGILPGLIGLLPMPGGALFSAPLVDSCDPDNHVPGLLKAQANHWFRHSWEYWWPLYPSVLVAMEITGFEVWQMMFMGVPLMLGGLAAGYAFILGPITSHEESSQRDEETEFADSIIRPMCPILIVIVVYALISGGYTVASVFDIPLPALNRYMPMATGLICAMAMLQIMRPVDRKGWLHIVFSSRTLNMLVIVALVRIYGAYIQANQPGGEPLMTLMRREMFQWGIAPGLVIMLLPFVSGLATGIGVGFVGASFPIVMMFVPETGGFWTALPIIMLAYACGYMGIVLSPVHVCVIVTCEHYEVPVPQLLLKLLRPALVVVLWAILLYAFYQHLLPILSVLPS
ncbi:MAG: DUF401 family protein [Planctomycetota bacterium]